MLLDPSPKLHIYPNVPGEDKEVKRIGTFSQIGDSVSVKETYGGPGKLIGIVMVQLVVPLGPVAFTVSVMEYVPGAV